MINKYKCSGPDRSPICLYDYTVLNTLNDYFVFSVPTLNLPVENHYYKKEITFGTQMKKEPEVKLTKGTNLYKLIDIDYLNDLKPI